MTMMSAVIPPGSLSSNSALEQQQEDERQKLLASLLKSVKACQTRFGGRSQLATESEPCVAVLCTALEAVLLHGLKMRPGNGQASTLRHMTELVSSSLSLSRVLPQDNPAPWRFIRETLTRHESERFLLLKRVCTDWGRGRAWLRASLNERSLERGLNFLRAAPNLSYHYHTWAFLRDEERASTLTTMAAGLGSVLFAINVDNNMLNDGDPERISRSALFGQLEPEIKLSASEDEQRPQHLRRRKAPPTIVSFDDDICTPVSSTSEISEYPFSSAPPTCLNSPISPQPPTSSQLPAESSGKNQGATLTPVTNAGVGELIPVFPNGNIAAAATDEEDSISVPSYSEDLDSAAAALLATQKLLEKQSAQLVIPPSPDKSEKNEESLIVPPEDPVTALHSLLSQCSALESENRALRSSLRQEQSFGCQISEELVELKRTSKDKVAQLQVRLQALTRENEMLKHQLKKYVAAVQMLNKDGTSAHQIIADLTPALNQYVQDEETRQQQNEESQYEQKLVQVAEMHGELMEFNERLQRALHNSESTAALLRAELELLRGPLPISSQASDSLLDPDSPSSLQATGALVHIWVPSAFLTGGTSDVHHVYQVYVRIKNEEWNVYRRYAQFHSLHRDLKRRHPAVKNFDFPPKKTLGNKDARFVEERRLRLQKYLRHVVNHVVQESMQDDESPSKELLIQILPFFGEGPHVRERNNRARSSSASRSPRTNIPLYTGL
ncbi:sorting nexin-29 [Neocloeon triangulifer]|uniref:sorting nexin-29 n=1 Tax=Neocloeon triangulifer TaxID=2078957 RepID=UPI00286F65B7|nr:sorting nexin-29 [Neocloeon triangulifer]